MVHSTNTQQARPTDSRARKLGVRKLGCACASRLVPVQELHARFTGDKAVNFHFHPQYMSFCLSPEQCFSINFLLRTESLSADLVRARRSPPARRPPLWPLAPLSKPVLGP